MSPLACASYGLPFIFEAPLLMGYGIPKSDSRMFANVIQGFPTGFGGGRAMSFGDIRVAERAEWLIERVATAGTLVLRKLGETRAGEKAVHRFLSSPYVSVDRIVETLAARTAKQCVGRRILAVQDTTEINFAGRDKKRRGFGPAGDGKTPGFFIHPVIAIDIETEAVVGLVDAEIWTRSVERVTSRRSRSIDAKESARWLSGCQAAAGVLSDAHVTMVADRESDIYLLFAHRPERLDLIVRAAQDRKLADDGLLFEALAQAELLSTTNVRVAPRGPGDKGRIAKVELRAGTVRIARPNIKGLADASKTVELTLVEAREIDPPPGKTRCSGACLPPAPSPAPRRPKRLCNCIACAGASSKSSARSRAMVSPWTTAKSSTRNACSTSRPSDWPVPSEPSSSLTPETAALGQRAT
jgi:hypothetical protein